MNTMAQIARLEVVIFLALLGVVLVSGIVSGSINTKGLLQDDRTKRFSGGRLQLLLATLVGASAYILSILQASSNSMPEVPGVLLLLVGGGNVGYLSSKIYSHVWADITQRGSTHE